MKAQLLDTHLDNARRLQRAELMQAVDTAPFVIETKQARVTRQIFAAAYAALAQGIKEPVAPGSNGAPQIDGFIRGNMGLGWPTADAKTWRPNYPYTSNGDFAWCLAFVAHCYRMAGVDAELAYNFMSSCTRIRGRGPAGKSPFKLTITGWNLTNEYEPGKIALCGTRTGTKDNYTIDVSHGTLIVGRDPKDPNYLITIEGNAKGYGNGWDTRGYPLDEARYEGVVMMRRRICYKPEDGYGVQILADLPLQHFA